MLCTNELHKCKYGLVFGFEQRTRIICWNLHMVKVSAFYSLIISRNNSLFNLWRDEMEKRNSIPSCENFFLFCRLMANKRCRHFFTKQNFTLVFYVLPFEKLNLIIRNFHHFVKTKANVKWIQVLCRLTVLVLMLYAECVQRRRKTNASENNFEILVKCIMYECNVRIAQQ